MRIKSSGSFLPYVHESLTPKMNHCNVKTESLSYIGLLEDHNHLHQISHNYEREKVSVIVMLIPQSFQMHVIYLQHCKQNTI